nr:response regulator transcription factor [Actinomycetales bacterium]
MVASNFRILVVEDERDIAEQIARRLESEGWEVRQVHDGLEAVSEARDFAPDAVVLDVMLPGIDGL